MKTPTKLYVAWQDPIERHWFPVGLVTCTSSGFESAFFTRGVRYLEEETQTRWERESPSKPIVAEMEPDNPFDPNAVMLFSNDHTPIGHVPRYYTAAISSLLRVHSKNASFELVHHNQEPAPPGERFLIQAKILVPEGWTFDVSGELAPIKSAGANAA